MYSSAIENKKADKEELKQFIDNAKTQIKHLYKVTKDYNKNAEKLAQEGAKLCKKRDRVHNENILIAKEQEALRKDINQVLI